MTVTLVDQTIEDQIRNHGRKFMPAVLPPDLHRWPVGYCFDACAIQALYNRKYRYVEGIAKSYQSNEWKLHAWLTDGIHAFDPTWGLIENFSGKELPFPGEYIGIEMDIVNVAAFMAKTKYQGVIGNRHRDPELATAAIGVEI